MISQTLRITMLYDFYGALLTERQQSCVEMHYLDDWSLAEIAEHFVVSRQAVHDILKRSVQTMETFEQKLGLIEKHNQGQKAIEDVLELIDKAIVETKGKYMSINKANEKIKQLLSQGGA